MDHQITESDRYFTRLELQHVRAEGAKSPGLELFYMKQASATDDATVEFQPHGRSAVRS